MEAIFWSLVALALILIYFGFEVVRLLKSIEEDISSVKLEVENVRLLRDDVREILREIRSKLDFDARVASDESRAKYQEERQATIAAQRRDARRG